MSSVYSEMNKTEARGNYQYLGLGDYVVKLLEIKDWSSELKFIVEVEIVEARGEAAVHRPGDTVSWLVNYGGDKRQSEMGKKDVRGFNDALIVSAGGDCSAWGQGQWIDFGSRCAKAANCAGINLRVIARPYTKSDGTPGKIPSVSWLAVKGQPRREELVGVYGASASTAAPKAPPAPRGGPPAPGGVQKHARHADLVEAARGYIEAGEATEIGSELHAWAVSEGVSDAQYRAAMAEAGAQA